MREPLDGLDGLDGQDGASAYEIALAEGFVGSRVEWLASLKGEQGEKGDRGEIGPQGEIGPIGNAGRDGIDGANGLPGTPGTNGKDGKDGRDGRDAQLPKRQAWTAEFERAADLTTSRVRVEASDRSSAWDLFPAYTTYEIDGARLRLMTTVDLLPSI